MEITVLSFGIYLLTIGIIVATGLIFLILGIRIRKKRKKTSNVRFGISGIIGGYLCFILISSFLPSTTTIMTRKGKVKIYDHWSRPYEAYMSNGNIEELRKLINKHPEMIYYYNANQVSLLDYGMYTLNLELMQLALDHGAIFDDPLRYDDFTYENSFDSFFDLLGYCNPELQEKLQLGETTDEIIETVEFMLNHGASLEYETTNKNGFQNFYEEAEDWIMIDSELSEKDRELLNLIQKNME